MKNSVKIIIVSLITVLCIAIGYFGAEFVRGNLSTTAKSSDKVSQPTDAHRAPAGKGTASGTVTTRPPTPATPPKSTPATPVAPEINTITSPAYNEDTKRYTFTVSASGSNLKYNLWANSTKIKTQDNGIFIVDGLDWGSYSVYVTDTRTGMRSKKRTVPGCLKLFNKLTQSEIQNAFNSGDYQEGDKLDFSHCLRGCKFTFNGLKPSEETPSSYSEIFNRIGLGTWRSVTVWSIQHDSQNRVKKMSITVNY